MKTMLKGEDVRRVPDKTNRDWAYIRSLIAKGWSFTSKSAWKKLRK